MLCKTGTREIWRKLRVFGPRVGKVVFRKVYKSHPHRCSQAELAGYDSAHCDSGVGQLGTGTRR